jgi:hypothetical protein
LRRKFDHKVESGHFGLRVNIAQPSDAKVEYEIKSTINEKPFNINSEMQKFRYYFVLWGDLPTGSYEVFLHINQRLTINSIEMLSESKFIYPLNKGISYKSWMKIFSIRFFNN